MDFNIYDESNVNLLLEKIQNHIDTKGLVDLAYHLDLKTIATITMWLRRGTIPESRREHVAKFFGLA